MSVGLGSVLMNKLGGFASSDPDQVSVSSITLFVTLLCISVVLGHLLEENKWINESVNALFIGLGTGTILLLATNGVSSRILEFNEELFFIYLLPPIIFNAGFQVKKKQFFRNFMTITLFGAVGTMISFCIISFGAKLLFDQLNFGYLELQDYLAIGAIFSATDSVCTLQVLNQDETPFLHSLVFGEGVVNDATSVVLFNAIQKFDLSEIDSTMAFTFIGNFFYLFITSTLLGVLMGLLSAYIIRKLYFGRHSTDREVALMILMAYLSYIMAELFDLSGILTVFFCGIVMSHYTWHNVTESSRVTTKHAFATLSFIAETFIFLYVGMDALDLEKWKFASSSPGKSVGASAALFGLVVVGRAAFIFPLSFLFNFTKKSKSDKLNLKQQVTIWWAGLMRGAVSMALAYNQFAKSGHTKQPGNAIMITCTITVVLFTTVVFGLLTKHFVRFMFPPSDHINDRDVSEPSSPTSPMLPLLSNGEANGVERNVRRPCSLQMLLSAPTNTVHYYWRKFDDAFMRPVFGGRGFAEFVPGTPREDSDSHLV
ncbi:sodium/hydrogen exchanger 1-like [Salvia miltiorrhiza]|uniref:sodium/hydrogen exchanger 1-like n=1 Tax=Salvia miltiorrhiza TaxID=226208 RepID=UPI0025ABFA32|nr:sodium/hydrogen exchanger 1-like [Salvia miltiorrhiza]XP_057780159.1 sodium/hydrogen exchanger 1-like [Salvia miltiorrhiza]